MKTTQIVTLFAVLASCVAGCAADAGDDEEVASSQTDGLKSSSYNCRPDKRIDVPATITSATALGPRKVHLAASAPSDASGSVVISQYVFTDPAGVQFNLNPQTNNVCPLAKVDNPLDYTVEKVAAATRYSVVAISKDKCGNTATSGAVEVTTPAQAPETNGPVVSAPQNVRLTVFVSSAPGVVVFAKDDTAVERVEFYVNGSRISDGQYNDLYRTGGGVHGYSDPRGEAYFQLLPTSVRGTTANILVKTYDVLGNVTETTGTLAVPAN